MTGVQKYAILCDICGYLSGFLADNGCIAGEVSTYIAKEAVFVDTCRLNRAGAGAARAVPSSSRSVQRQPPETVYSGGGAPGLEEF